MGRLAALGVGLLGLTSSCSGVSLVGVTPGTACNGTDVTNWKGTGYKFFESNLQACTLLHFELNPVQSGNNDRIVEKVSKCMQNLPGFVEDKNGNSVFQGEPFSSGCADCMGKLTECTTDTCPTDCFLGGSASESCRECTENACLLEFYKCSGFDTRCPPGEDCEPEASEPFNMIYVFIGVGALLGLILLIGVPLMVSRYNRKLKANQDEFARQLEVAAANAPKITAPLPQLTRDVMSLKSMERPLIVLYAFQADHESELTVSENEELVGIQVVDEEWWYAKNRKGQFGLVPRSYVEDLAPPLPQDDDVQEEMPNF